MRTARAIPWLALAALAAVESPATQPRPVTFLGVGTTPVSPALRTQLGLPDGVGLLVEMVEPDSPAARAGVVVNDVIVRLDGQGVAGTQPFGDAIRGHAPGDIVRLDAVRRGGPVTLAATLDARSDAPAPPHAGRVTAVVQRTDAEHSITLVAHGNERHVRVVETGGRLIYDGPFDTAADAAKLPPACRAKVETLQRDFEAFKRQRAASGPVR